MLSLSRKFNQNVMTVLASQFGCDYRTPISRHIIPFHSPKILHKLTTPFHILDEFVTLSDSVNLTDNIIDH